MLIASEFVRRIRDVICVFFLQILTENILSGFCFIWDEFFVRLMSRSILACLSCSALRDRVKSDSINSYWFDTVGGQGYI